ncbi:MAG: HAMP domain-containing histidine kinase, partial [Elusimicrobia bacterium]|nr:HAMP domain-containing histidine kinase [Elusimicrobiota bacterium]
MRLSHRLSLVFFLFGLAIAGGLQYNHLHELRSVAYERERRLAEAATAAVKALVESQVRAGVGLGRGLDQMLRHTDIAEISVVDARGRRLLERFDTASLLGRKPHPGLALERVRDGVYDVEKSVVLRGRREGRLEIGFRTGPLEARLREIAGQAVRSTFMALLAITLLAWLIGAWFALRIERIVPRIEVLSRDPLEFKPLRASGGSDEVARLAAAFNRLGASLKSEILRRRELEREKQELSAMLVHDLKTPLTVIRSGIALLREHLGELADTGAPAPPGSPRRTFELLDLSSQRLQRMVEDVLQLARLEEVSGLRERSAVDMAALLEACAKDFALVAAERKQRLLVKLPRAPLPRVLGDPALLRRV